MNELNPGNPRRLPLIVAGLLLILASGFVLRNHLFTGSKDSPFTPYYSSEAAQYLRYAKMASDHFVIPRIDVPVQEPEGFRVDRETPLLLEYVSGYIHRIFFPRVPFRLFAEYFDWTCAALSAAMIFLLCLFFVSDVPLSLLAALYYAVSLAAVGRTVNGFFEKEIVCLPLILLHLAGFLRFAVTRKIVWAAVSAALALMMLAAWKISQFYYLLFLVYPVLKFCLSRKTEEFRGAFIVYFGLQTSALVLAALLFPHLRAQMFLFSPAVVVCASLTVFLLLDRLIRPAWWIRTVGLASLVGLSLLSLPRSVDGSFAFSVALFKLKYFFRKPLDPGLLPPVVRAYWVGPFESPSAGLVLYTFTTSLAWGVAGLALLLKRLFARTADLKAEFLLCLNLVFIAVFFLFNRMVVLAAIPLALDAAYILAAVASSPRRVRLLLALGLTACIVFETAKTWTFASPRPWLSGLLAPGSKSMKYEEFSTRTRSVTRMLEYLESRAELTGPVVAGYSLSPSVLLYTGKSVLFTPAVFERGESTAKFMSVFSNLYASEDAFYNACRKFGARTLVYSTDLYFDNSVYSTRYITARTDTGREDCSRLLQFDPGRLRHFRLVWQNESFRIFRIDPAEPVQRSPRLAYSACYDPAVFAASGLSGPEFLTLWDRASSLKSIGDGYLARNLGTAAEQAYTGCLELQPRFPDVLANLGRIYLGRGLIEKAEEAFGKSLEIDDTPEARYGLTLIRFFRRDPAGRENGLNAIVRNSDPPYLPALLDLAAIRASRHDLSGGIELLKRAVAAYPEKPDLRGRLADLYQKAGRSDLASEYYPHPPAGTGGTGR